MIKCTATFTELGILQILESGNFAQVRNFVDYFYELPDILPRR